MGAYVVPVLISGDREALGAIEDVWRVEGTLDVGCAYTLPPRRHPLRRRRVRRLVRRLLLDMAASLAEDTATL